MNIIISGCGDIGKTAVSSLTSEDHNVTVIDKCTTTIDEIVSSFDAMGVIGNGADSDAQLEAGIDTCDLFVATTESDELNMLSCFLAKRLGADHTICRIRTPEYNDQTLSIMRNELQIDLTINPELLTAIEIYNILKLPGATNIETFSSRRLEMVEVIIKEDSPLNNMSLMDLRKKFTENFIVCAVQRDDEVFIPTGQFVLKSNDRIRITATPFTAQKLLKKVGLITKQAKNVMILGAGRASYYLSKLLIAGGHSVKIIEKDYDNCTAFSEALPEAIVIHGNGAEQDLLTEEGIDSMDAFVALTDSDEEDILVSFFAISKNVAKVIAKVNRTEIATMAEKLGLDCIISPKKIVSDIITRYARALENSKGSNVEKLYKIIDGKAEALEFNVSSDFKGLDVPLKDLNFKKNVLIAGIIRGKQTIIPTGNDVIMLKDKVIAVATGIKMNDLSDILQ